MKNPANHKAIVDILNGVIRMVIKSENSDRILHVIDDSFDTVNEAELCCGGWNAALANRDS